MRRTVFVSKISCRTTSGLLWESFKRENPKARSMGAALFQFRGGVEDTCAEQMHRRTRPMQTIVLRCAFKPPNLKNRIWQSGGDKCGFQEESPRPLCQIRFLRLGRKST
jgi:hypothetical protein